MSSFEIEIKDRPSGFGFKIKLNMLWDTSIPYIGVHIIKEYHFRGDLANILAIPKTLMWVEMVLPSMHRTRALWLTVGATTCWCGLTVTTRKAYAK